MDARKVGAADFGDQLYYAEAFAVRTVARPDKCPAGVYYQARFRRSASTPTVLHQATFDGYDCDSPGAEPSKVIPYGVVRIANRFFVAVERWHYEGGMQELFQLTRTSLTPSYPAEP